MALATVAILSVFVSVSVAVSVSINSPEAGYNC